MSLLNLLNIGKSALLREPGRAERHGPQHRQRQHVRLHPPGVVLEIATPAANSAGYLGRGVTVAGVQRSYARFVAAQLLGQEQSLGKSTAMNEILSQVEQVFNDSSGMGLSESLEAFFDSWQSLSSDPDDSAQRTVLLSDAESLVSTAKQMETDLLGTIGEINDEIADIAGQVNTIAGKIADLNDQIAKIEAGDTGRDGERPAGHAGQPRERAGRARAGQHPGGRQRLPDRHGGDAQPRRRHAGQRDDDDRRRVGEPGRRARRRRRHFADHEGPLERPHRLPDRDRVGTADGAPEVRGRPDGGDQRAPRRRVRARRLDRERFLLGPHPVHDGLLRTARPFRVDDHGPDRPDAFGVRHHHRRRRAPIP